MSLVARRVRHGQVSTALALLSDSQLAERLNSASHLGSGIGGTTWRLDVDGVPVFVKRVALTDLESRPENYRSTANIFELPVWSHYGLGSAGSGAWRELAAHIMTSDWVLTGQCENFLLLHHWRVFTRPPRQKPDPAELARNVAFWHDNAAVRARLVALADSSADLVLFLEYIPHNIHEWLSAKGGDAEYAMVARDLIAMTGFLGERAFQHFDAHFGNFLTDGERLYLTDFGLALSARFDLTDAETRFLRQHALHDAAYVVTHLVNWVVTAPPGQWPLPHVRNDIVRRCAQGDVVPELSPHMAAFVRRYAPVAAVINDFYVKLFGESRKTPYPGAEIERAWPR